MSEKRRDRRNVRRRSQSRRASIIPLVRASLPEFLPGGPAESASAARTADRQPARPGALETGTAYLKRGDLDRARACFDEALRADPNSAVAHNCLGIVSRISGQREEAIRRFQEALRLQPGLAEAHNNLGNAHRDVHQLEEAAASYRRALALKPEFSEAHNNLGVVLLSRDDVTAAIACFERALQLNPAYAEALNNLGNARQACGQLEAARSHFSAALQLLPQAAEVHNNLANVLREMGDLTAARTHYIAALRLLPQSMDVYHNLGSVQVELEDLSGAVATYRKAAAVLPESAATLVHLGNVYRLRGDTNEARAAYQAASRLAPEDHSVPLRIAALCPIVFSSREAAERYRADSLAEWRRLADVPLRSGDLLAASLAEPPFELQFLHGNLRPHREAFAGIYQSRFPDVSLAPRRSRPRVGIVVTRSHEGIFLKSMRGLIELLPPRAAELVIVCPRGSLDTLRKSIRRDLDFLPLPRGFSQIQRQLREAAFDLLYYWEVGTDATNYFLPFLRLAPVQCTAWGYQTTSGIANVDYYLSSALVESPDADAHYSETLIRSSTLLTYQQRIDARPGDCGRVRRQFGIPEGRHVYLCPHQLGKFHPDFDEPLASILRRDPQGEVLILSDRHNVAGTQLAQRFQETMPDVVGQVRFLPRQDRRAYLDLIAVADVILDPPHFSGANTSYDALGLGKAVVTRPTEYRRGRFTLACYRKMGLTDLVVSQWKEYVDLAVNLANDPVLRRETERRLREAGPVLFEEAEAAREFTRIIEQLIQIARGELGRAESAP